MRASKKETKKCLQASANNIVEKYRNDYVQALHRFHGLSEEDIRKYISMDSLFKSFKKRQMVQRLFLIWLTGLLEFVLRFFKLGIELPTVEQHNLVKILYATKVNYLKEITRNLNEELRQEFLKHNYTYQEINLTGPNTEIIDYPQISSKKFESKRTRFLRQLNKFASFGRIWSALGVILSTLSALISYFLKSILHLFNMYIYIGWSAKALVITHFFTGISKVLWTFNRWGDDIAEAICREARENPQDIDSLTASWMNSLNYQVSVQIERGRTINILERVGAKLADRKRYYQDYKSARREAAGSAQRAVASPPFWITVFILFTLLVGSVFVFSARQQALSQAKAEHIAEALNREGHLLVLEKTGSEIYSLTTQKELFEGTVKIPLTAKTITVPYDYRVQFNLDLTGITAGNIEIKEGIAYVHLALPACEIRIANDEPAVNGSLFSTDTDPRLELEQLEPEQGSYYNILQNDIKEKLLAQDTWHLYEAEAKQRAGEELSNLLAEYLKQPKLNLQVVFSQNI